MRCLSKPKQEEEKKKNTSKEEKNPEDFHLAGAASRLHKKLKWNINKMKTKWNGTPSPKKKKQKRSTALDQTNYSWIIHIMAAGEEGARTFTESVGFVRGQGGGGGRRGPRLGPPAGPPPVFSCMDTVRRSCQQSSLGVLSSETEACQTEARGPRDQRWTPTT